VRVDIRLLKLDYFLRSCCVISWIIQNIVGLGWSNGKYVRLFCGGYAELILKSLRERLALWIIDVLKLIKNDSGPFNYSHGINNSLLLKQILSKIQFLALRIYHYLD
jgi:hypothetical protein